MAEFTIELEASITEGARRLGRALEILGYPNGGKDAPCHEINAVINIAACLGRLEEPYHLYAEGTTAKRGRIDLMGFNGRTAGAYLRERPSMALAPTASGSRT